MDSYSSKSNHHLTLVLNKYPLILSMILCSVRSSKYRVMQLGGSNRLLHYHVINHLILLLRRSIALKSFLILWNFINSFLPPDILS